ncbi:MAG TPA: sigma-70 family RNA polymerase sigma factor [Candidatus Limnocylindrales bacterium]
MDPATSANARSVEPFGSDGEQEFVDALRAGDEPAFLELVGRLQRPLVRMAMLYVRDRDVAEEVVQETWIAVVKGIHRFEGRSSLRTWISRIVTYQARTRGERERRTVPLSELLDPVADPGGSSVDPDRFRPAPPWQGHWAEPPASWGPDAEERLLAAETQAVITATLERLSAAQRTVMTLRDVEGWTSDEVCEALEISPGNQRVLLHRARSRVRGALERYLAEAEAV